MGKQSKTFVYGSQVNNHLPKHGLVLLLIISIYLSKDAEIKIKHCIWIIYFYLISH